MLMYLKWYHYKIQLGISRFAQEAGWHLNSRAIQYTGWKPSDWIGDGIIASGEPEVIEDDLSHLPNAPIVSFGSKPCPDRFMVVDHDEEALDTKVFNYFRQSGYFRFLLVGTLKSKRRGSYIPKLIKEHGGACHELHTIDDFPHPWEQSRLQILECLKKLKYPLAVYALTDELAVGVIETAVQAGIRVPEDIAVLGVHNDEFVCNSVRPSLSSIDNDLEGMGYEAARKLHAAMTGQPEPRISIVPPREVVVRESTVSVGFKSEALRKGVKFLRERFREPITLDDAAQASGVCKEYLGRLMKKEMNTSIHSELLRLRLNYACAQLTNTEEKVSAIALDSGFSTNTAFYIAFRRTLGCAPGQYRSANRTDREVSPAIRPGSRQ